MFKLTFSLAGRINYQKTSESFFLCPSSIACLIKEPVEQIKIINLSIKELIQHF